MTHPEPPPDNEFFEFVHGKWIFVIGDQFFEELDWVTERHIRLLVSLAARGIWSDIKSDKQSKGDHGAALAAAQHASAWRKWGRNEPWQ